MGSVVLCHGTRTPSCLHVVGSCHGALLHVVHTLHKLLLLLLLHAQARLGMVHGPRQALLRWEPHGLGSRQPLRHGRTPLRMLLAPARQAHPLQHHLPGRPVEAAWLMPAQRGQLKARCSLLLRVYALQNHVFGVGGGPEITGAGQRRFCS